MYKTVALLTQEYSNQRGALGPLEKSKSLDRVEILSSLLQDSNVAHRAVSGTDIQVFQVSHSCFLSFHLGWSLSFQAGSCL